MCVSILCNNFLVDYSQVITSFIYISLKLCVRMCGLGGAFVAAVRACAMCSKIWFCKFPTYSRGLYGA